MANYVKFFRGTPNAYSILPVKDSDTLYFIAEKDALTGKLYLGEQLISDSTTSAEVVTKLGDLADVDVSGVGDKKVLSYDTETEKWIPIDVNLLVSGGLTQDDVDGTTITIEDGKLVAKVITYTLTAEEVAEGNGITVTLTGSDGSTSSITITDPDLSDYYTKTETDQAIADAVAKIGRLQRQVFETLEEAQTFVNNNKDTADEYIFMIPNEDGGYDEYMYFPEKDALEKVGSWGGTDLSQYVTETELEQALAGLEPNFIKSVNVEQFTVDTNGRLDLKAVPVNVINGLDQFITDNRDAIAGLYSVTDADKLFNIEAGAQVNIIDSVHPDQFIITEAKQLELKAVPIDKIPELGTNFVSIVNFNTVVGNLDDLLNNGKTTTIVDDIAELDQRLTWQEMAET